MIEILLKGSKEAQNWGKLPWRELKSLNIVLNFVTHPQSMVLAETSAFAIFCDRNVRGRNVLAEMSEHHKKYACFRLHLILKLWR